MRVFGWIMLVLGVISLFGALFTGYGLLSCILWIVLGAYLIHRANQKDKEKEDRDKWIEGK